MRAGRLVSCLVLAAVGSAQAQSPVMPDSQPAATAPWRVGLFVGAAHDSPITRLSVTPARDHFMFGVDASTPILRAGPVRVSYGAQLLPLVVIRAPSYTIVDDWPGGGIFRVDGVEPVYAVGMSPFGLDLTVPVGRRLEVYGATAAGVLLFSRRYPVPDAQRANFTLEAGGGLRVAVGRERWIRAGYKYHHMSNAFLAQSNPGLDAHFFYAGYHWSTRLRR